MLPSFEPTIGVEAGHQRSAGLKVVARHNDAAVAQERVNFFVGANELHSFAVLGGSALDWHKKKKKEKQEANRVSRSEF